MEVGAHDGVEVREEEAHLRAAPRRVRDERRPRLKAALPRLVGEAAHGGVEDAEGQMDGAGGFEHRPL